MPQNISLGSKGVDWVRSLRKIPKRLCGTNFCTSSARFAPSFVRQPNDGSLGSNGVDRVRSWRKIRTRLRGTNFCTSSAHCAPSFVRQLKGPESTQIVRNAPKRQFRVQWCGSGALVAKNSDATSCMNFCINCTSSARFAPSLVQY